MKFDKAMMCATQCDKVGRLVGRFPISIKLSIWNDVVNIYASHIFLAYLAFSIIALECFSSLTKPVLSTVGMLSAAYVVGVVIASHCNAFFGVSTIIGAETADSGQQEVFVNRVRAATPLTNKLSKVLWPWRSWFWLMRSKLTHALPRTKPWLSVRPCFKRFVAPVTCKDGFLARICTGLTSTAIGAILTVGVTMEISKIFSTLWTGENFRRLFTWHFNTPYSVEALNAAGAHGLGCRVCQQVISLLKPHKHYIMLLSL